MLCAFALAVVITSRNQHHAAESIAALQAGKHVFVEKPLCVDEAGLTAIVGAKEQAPGQIVMVGFTTGAATTLDGKIDVHGGALAFLLLSNDH